jgi:imidazolonepropionase-like amidohydrolase
VRFTAVDEVVPSPDGSRVALTRNESVWVMELPPFTTTTVDVDLDAPAFPAKRLSEIGASYVGWKDPRTVTWGSTNWFYTRSLDQEKPESTAVIVDAPRATPRGSVAFTDARLVTMRGDEVIERGTVVVTNGRITAVGPSGSVNVPADAVRVDAAGKTIMPGLIDVLAHLFYNAYELFPQQKWQMIANLAYGVTTAYDPSAHSIDVFPQSEMVETGDLLGPRIYSSGDVIYGTLIFPSMFATIDSAGDARRIVRKYKRYGSLMLKQYLQPTRIQRQYLAQAAREEGVRITAEGGADMYLDLSMVADGYTAFEHSLPVAPLYRDVVEFNARVGTHYTPTLLVSYGGPTAEDYFYALDNHHDDAKLRRFVPEDVLDYHRRRQVIPEAEYHFTRVSQAAAAITKAGGKVTLGAHGQLQGLGAHWELWGLQMGGLSNHEALRAATRYPAEKLGMETELGSLGPGMAADFLVLDANPLENIRNTTSLRYVVKNGFVYDAESMTQVWPDRRKLDPFFWMTAADARRFAAPEAPALGGGQKAETSKR